jgi:hypothetical protein
MHTPQKDSQVMNDEHVCTVRSRGHSGLRCQRTTPLSRIVAHFVGGLGRQVLPHNSTSWAGGWR